MLLTLESFRLLMIIFRRQQERWAAGQQMLRDYWLPLLKNQAI